MREVVESPAEKNRSSRARGKALANIQAHLEYLERTIDGVNQQLDQLNQQNQSSLDRFNLLKTVPSVSQV